MAYPSLLICQTNVSCNVKMCMTHNHWANEQRKHKHRFCEEVMSQPTLNKCGKEYFL